MDFSRILKEALESIGSNKLRATLTMLGIVIGVAAVIAMLAIGTGAQNQITSQLEGIGASLFYVFSGGDASNPEPITLKDAEAMGDSARAPSVAAVAPFVQGNTRVSVPGESSNTQTLGITPTYMELQSMTVAEGAGITEQNVEDQDAVVVLGSEVADNLFGTTNGLVGEIVRIDDQPFRVVGVLEEQGGTTFGSSDNRILVPLSTARLRLLKRSGVGEVDQIIVQAKDADSVDPAIEEVSQILRTQHIANLGQDDFTIRNTQAFLETAQSITTTLTIFLGSIAGVSLLVGGIGIMNIMLVSVIERTREIGLRKAVGARRRDIQIQFLIESLVLSIAGGALGILLGWLIAQVVTTFFSLTAKVNLDSILLATIFSAAVGIFFGLYPANQAAKLEPVEALRTE